MYLGHSTGRAVNCLFEPCTHNSFPGIIRCPFVYPWVHGHIIVPSSKVLATVLFLNAKNRKKKPCANLGICSACPISPGMQQVEHFPVHGQWKWHLLNFCLSQAPMVTNLFFFFFKRPPLQDVSRLNNPRIINVLSIELMINICIQRSINYMCRV